MTENKKIKNPQLDRVNKMTDLEITEAIVTQRWPEKISTHMATPFGVRLLQLRQFEKNLKTMRDLKMATWGLVVVTFLLILATVFREWVISLLSG